MEVLMSKISNIIFNKIDGYNVSILICLDSGVSGCYNIKSRKYLRYIDLIKDGLIGMEVFDQVSIDDCLINLNIDRSLCMGISSSVLSVASKEEDVELFQYVSDEYYIPDIVIDVNGVLVLANDYYKIKSFLNFLDSCSWNISDNELNDLLLRYDLDFFNNNYKFIDINEFKTITDIFDVVDEYSDSSIMISESDIVYDLAVALGIDYIKIGKSSNVDRFLKIIDLFD